MAKTRKGSITIGTSDTGPVRLDLAKLISHRMLVQATSGGGKSYFLRVLAEQAGPKVQVVILDPEGEFSTLRERLDVVLVSPDGEVPPNPRNAALLGRKLVELRTSAVCDLYELEKPKRRAFVRQFLDALMAVPRKLYHPMLVILDEAHDYAPERSHGEAESTASVINLMSKGRKRGFSGILATQRPSKLHKDAAAEAGNILIGRTSPVDPRRAADLLGIPAAERGKFARLSTGEWFGYGPALEGADILRFQASKAKTSHPKAGEAHAIETPAPSAAIRRVAGELSDVARGEDADPITLDEAAATISKLRRELRTAKRSTGAGPDPELTAEVKRLERELLQRDRAHRKAFQTLEGRLKKIATLASMNGVAPPEAPKASAARRPSTGGTAPRAKAASKASVEKLPRAESRILTVLSHYPNGRSKRQIAVLTCYSHKGGGFNNALGALRSRGFIEGGQERIVATDDGLAALGPVDPLPTGMDLVDHWKRQPQLGRAEGLVLDALVEAYPDGLTKEELAGRTGYEARGGGLNNALGKLRTFELIDGHGEIRAADMFFEETCR